MSPRCGSSIVRTLHRHEFREFLPYPKTRRKLPSILSQEEVARLINASTSLFQRTLLMVLYGTGMRRAELARLEDRPHRQPAHGHPRGRWQGPQGPRSAPEPDLAREPARLLAMAQAPHLPVPVPHASRSRAAHQRQDRMAGMHPGREEGRHSQESFAASGSTQPGPHICSKPVPICAPSSCCSAMRIWR